MTAITLTSLSLEDKKRYWKEHQYDIFKEISKDKSLMFNYFFKNNDIFKFISKQDQQLFLKASMNVQNRCINSFFYTLFAVFGVDQIFLRIVAPGFRINRFRPLVIMFKYLLIPSIGFTIYKQFFLNKQMQFFYSMQQKYGFGFEDFKKADNIFKRALQVDRLEQLLDKRSKFDWTGIPQLPQDKDDQQKQKQAKKEQSIYKKMI